MKKHDYLKSEAAKLTAGHIDRRQFVMSALAAGIVLPTALTMAVWSLLICTTNSPLLVLKKAEERERLRRENVLLKKKIAGLESSLGLGTMIGKQQGIGFKKKKLEILLITICFI